jgi:hypothetical protein
MVTSALTKSLQKKGVVSGPPTQLRLNATSRPLFDRHPTPAPSPSHRQALAPLSPGRGWRPGCSLPPRTLLLSAARSSAVTRTHTQALRLRRSNKNLIFDSAPFPPRLRELHLLCVCVPIPTSLPPNKTPDGFPGSTSFHPPQRLAIPRPRTRTPLGPRPPGLLCYKPTPNDPASRLPTAQFVMALAL